MNQAERHRPRSAFAAADASAESVPPTLTSLHFLFSLFFFLLFSPIAANTEEAAAAGVYLRML